MKRTGPNGENLEGHHRTGLGDVNKHCLEPVVQIGLEPDKCNTVYLECVLEVGEKGGVVDRVKGSRQT